LGRSGADLKAIVSFHGGLDSPKPEDGKNIKAKVLALHGADDPFVTSENLGKFEEEMRSNRVDWQLVKFGGAVHSFTDKAAGNDPSRGAAYNESADKRSWNAMISFFADSFR
jgi:dienelactone hydrolase